MLRIYNRLTGRRTLGVLDCAEDWLAAPHLGGDKLRNLRVDQNVEVRTAVDRVQVSGSCVASDTTTNRGLHVRYTEANKS